MIMADISLSELDLFLTICKLQSIKRACQDLHLNPSNVSKMLQKLETKAGARLMVRSRLGISLTPEGILFLKTAEQILELAPELNVQRRVQDSYQGASEVIGVGSLSFICTRLVSPCLGDWHQSRPQVRFRIVEFTHNKLSEWAGKEAFAVALHIEPLNWPKKWTSEKLGEFRWGLYGRLGHPLGSICTADQALRYPFVIPTGWSEKQGEFEMGQDQCPVPLTKRIHGSEATTAENALEIVQSTHHLCFVPEVATSHLIKAGKIKEISVQGWPEVRKSLYITVNGERIKRPTYAMMKTRLRSQLQELKAN